MKKFLNEFKEFINRGNVMDLAVGVIIGGAFTSIVTSLTTDIINPLITVIAGGGADSISGLIVPGTEIDFGKFLSAVINFLIVAFVVFMLVKGLNKLQNASTKVLHLGKDGEDAEESEPAVPTCPFCLEEVKSGATRCPHCAAELPKPATENTAATAS